MNFAELIVEVSEITRRPDLLGRTGQAVRAATLKAHNADTWYKDLLEQSVEFGQVHYVQNFDPKDIFPTFKKAKYIRFWNGDIDGEPGAFLEPIQIENSLDSYNAIKTDVYYQAGALLQLRTSCPIQRCLFGAYVYPTILPAELYKSWIADEVPYAIIHEAARQVFAGIGLLDEANAQASLFADQITEMRMTYVDAIPLT